MDRRTQRATTALALLSLGLGSVQVAAPRMVAGLVGADAGPTTRALTRWACGVRELTAGMGAGWSARPAGWLWARVAGDVVDLALLGTVLARRPGKRARALGAAAAVLALTAADIVTAWRATPPRSTALEEEDVSQPPCAHAVITIDRPVSLVFTGCRQRVDRPPGAGGTVEVTDEIADELIAWRDAAGSSGWVSFRPAPGGRGTEVHAHVTLEPQAGWLAAAAARLPGRGPDRRLHADLQRWATGR
jgi:uncharacterized membrane protein